MQVKIAVRHGQLGDEAQSVIREKSLKLLHLFDRLTLIEVTVDMKRSEEDKLSVEYLVQAEHKHDFVARETAPDVLTAANAALHKVQAQIRHYKERIQDHRGAPSARDVAGPGDAV